MDEATPVTDAYKEGNNRFTPYQREAPPAKADRNGGFSLEGQIRMPAVSTRGTGFTGKIHKVTVEVKLRRV